MAGGRWVVVAMGAFDWPRLALYGGLIGVAISSILYFLIAVIADYLPEDDAMAAFIVLVAMVGLYIIGCVIPMAGWSPRRTGWVLVSIGGTTLVLSELLAALASALLIVAGVMAIRKESS